MRIENKLFWKLMKIFPLGIRMRITSKFDDRVKHLMEYQGKYVMKNMDWKGNINVYGAFIEESLLGDEDKADRLLEQARQLKKTQTN